MVLESRKRREHLSDEDLQKNRAIIDSFSKGNPGPGDSDNHPPEVKRRESLAPPAGPNMTWEEYSKCPAGQPPLLARFVVDFFYMYIKLSRIFLRNTVLQ